jgi:hypothetical protein
VAEIVADVVKAAEAVIVAGVVAQAVVKLIGRNVYK